MFSWIDAEKLLTAEIAEKIAEVAEKFLVEQPRNLAAISIWKRRKCSPSKR
jgi:hypothetical protein